MRKFLTLIVATLLAGTLFAGGLITNTNQSAAWVRLPVRNASVDIDAAYYNPAGLMKLENGFHFSLSNQTITQTRTIENFYKGPGGVFGLNSPNYDGEVTAPIFPSIYAVYKTNKVAFSLGFGPVGGGGGATYETGLPSFEMSPSDLVPALATQGASAYRLDAYLKGTSVFFGFQGGVSYKINDWLSVAAGLRYVSAKNKYNGHLKNIEINMGGTWLRADDIMNGLSSKLIGITTIPTQLEPLTSNPATQGLTLAQLVGAGLITAETQTGIESALAAIGVPPSNIPFMTVTQISGTVTTASPALLASAAKYSATAELLGDQEADVEQTGSGVTPFFSADFSVSEKLNIGIKYEMITKMNVKNKTRKDFLIGFTEAGVPITKFPNGEKIASDMPALLTLGIDYKITDGLKLCLGSEYFFDKTANYGHFIDLDNNPSTPETSISNKDIIAQNGWDIEAGLEVNLSEKFLISGGYIYANKGVNEKFQNDLNYGLASHTFGIGGAYMPSKNIQINLGINYTAYIKDETTINHFFSATEQLIPAKQNYDKNALIFGLGVDFSF
jgi:long-chain fatty acid transport protein